MSQSIRFLGVAVLAWVGVRAVSLGLVPGTSALAFDLPVQPAMQSAQSSPIHATEMPPLAPFASAVAQPPGPAGASIAGYPVYPSYAGYPPMGYAPYPVYMPMPASYPRRSAPVYREAAYEPIEPIPAHAYFQPQQSLENWADPGLTVPASAHQVTPSFKDEPVSPRFDRLQLSTWAMLRANPGTPGISGTGTLGGSQAGARLLWRYNPHLAASLRTSAPMHSQRGGEAALGIRYQPFLSIPIAITAERRKAFGQYGAGRNAFAVFAEGGLYGRSLPWQASLDAYLQAGVVGAKTRDWFVDGQAAVTRPVWRNLSAGVGVWGGAQPGLRRLDAGPRVSLRVGNRMRVHADYRHKLVGNVEPGSGGVLTLAGDF